ncbi:MAG TPA: hypothetical protein VGV67_13520, partial [Solirubrobacteraceae bacterium]|nr:hypothetical protein [Solirubrobacteraceae bacterium]
DYPLHGPEQKPDAEDVLKEINGYDLRTGELLDGFAQLKSDGSTASSTSPTSRPSRGRSTDTPWTPAIRSRTSPP